MRIKLTYVTPLLAAGAAAVAIVAAPTASAAPLPKTCVGNGPGMTCRSAGNVEITNLAPDVSFIPTGPCRICSAATERQCDDEFTPHLFRGCIRCPR